MTVLLRYVSDERQYCPAVNTGSPTGTHRAHIFAPVRAPCPTPDFLTSNSSFSSNEASAGLTQAARCQLADISLGSGLRGFREKPTHILNSHLLWAGLQASWPGCPGKWPQFHPTSPLCQTRLQGEKPTPYGVSPESSLERGLWDGPGLVFLPFGAGITLG